MAVLEVESDRRTLNVFYGMRRAKKEGRYMRIAPVGYVNKVREDGRKYIAPKQSEADIIKRAFEQVVERPFNVNQLADKRTGQEGKIRLVLYGDPVRIQT